MKRRAAAAAVLALAFVTGGAPPEPDGAEAKALAYLAREVPRWAAENRCYSCHNNGDAARALYEARRLGRNAGGDPRAVADTTQWLGRPEGWDHNGGDGPFSDKILARVQFTSALAAAVASDATRDRTALELAARRLAADQTAEGYWPVDGLGPVGSPASYGRPLATLAARDALRATNLLAYKPAVERAERWLLARPLASVMDASIALLTLPGRDAVRKDGVLREKALKRLRAAQSEDGGWGPFADAPSEPFDTALALLALSHTAGGAAPDAAVTRGRAFLAKTQQDDGSWPETTRPAGAESYAQRVSTTGWAALALMATRGRPQ